MPPKGSKSTAPSAGTAPTPHLQAAAAHILAAACQVALLAECLTALGQGARPSGLRAVGEEREER